MPDKAFIADTVFSLGDRDSGVDKAIGRINTSRISAAGTDASKFCRRQALWVTNMETGLSTLVFAMGGQSVTRNGIAIDYDSRHALGLKLHDRAVRLRVKPASRLQVVGYFLRHPNQGYRLGIQLGALGAGLGLISVLQLIGQIALWALG